MFDLLDFGLLLVEGCYVLVCLVMVCIEWCVDMCNLFFEYIVSVVVEMCCRGWKVVFVVDLELGKEWVIDLFFLVDI